MSPVTAMASAETLTFLLFIAVAASAKTIINCYDGDFYIRADPESCSYFYMCDNGKPVQRPCGTGLHFNSATHNCDWPYNANCEVKGQGTGAVQQSSGYSGKPTNSGAGQYTGYNGITSNTAGQYSSGYEKPSNNAGQHSGNDNSYIEGGQYNNAINGKPTSSNGQGQNYHGQSSQAQTPQQGQGQSDQNQEDNSLFYPVQSISQDTSVGPSINDPPLEQRPRPTVDDLYSGNQNPYDAYLNQNQNPNVDIRK